MINWSLGQTLENVERDIIIQALKFFYGNRTKAAQALGISIRTMTNKIALYEKQNIAVPKSQFGNKSNEAKEIKDDKATA